MKQIDLPLYKFYLIEGMTQEDLNELALERNNLSEEVYRLNNIINKKEQFLGDNIKRLEREVVKRDNIINELEEDFERKIQSCTIEAETTTNDFYCRLHIATLKRWLNKIKELKGVDKE